MPVAYLKGTGTMTIMIEKKPLGLSRTNDFI
jgi:hypothetical protein